MNYTLTWLSGETCCGHIGIRMYVNSLRRSGFNGKSIVLTHDMPAKTEKYLRDNDFTVVRVAPDTIHNIEHDRHIHFAQQLVHLFPDINNKTGSRVLISDCRDVVFQHDPFSVPTFDEEHINLVAEGMEHAFSAANMKDQTRFQEQLPVSYKAAFQTWPVINAGIMLGTPNALISFLQTLWVASMRIVCGDQSALNYIVHRFIGASYNIQLHHPHLSVFCVTGEGLQLGKYAPFILSKYHILHQWDRLSPDLIQHYTDLYS